MLFGSRKIVLIFLTLLPLVLCAQQDFADVEIQIHDVAENIYMLEGAGGNIGVCIGGDGVLMIDSQYGPLSDKIKAAIQTLSEAEINVLVNTHHHGDHTGGNENFGKEGAQIVAHQNVKERMSNVQKSAFRPEIPAAPEAARPVMTYTDEMEIRYNNQDIMLIHVDHAHTDGDGLVYFPESDVIHMGDTYFNHRYPYIDLGSGGSIDGIIEAANTALFLAGNNTKIIPGHGPLSNAEELREYRDVLMHLRREVAEAIKESKTLEEIQAMKPGAATDEGWGAAFINGDRIIEIIYKSLAEE